MRRLESGGQHHGIDIERGARGGDDRSLRHPLDGIGHECDVVPLQRPVEIVTEQNTLAAERIVRRQVAAQPLVEHGTFRKDVANCDRAATIGSSAMVAVLSCWNFQICQRFRRAASGLRRNCANSVAL